MAQPYIGEIRMFAGNFAPVNWALCNGQLLSISQYEALFTLLGTTYGGDGQTTFGLPNLQSRAPLHQGQGYPIGTQAGVERVTILTTQMPAHNHLINAVPGGGTQASPGNNYLAIESTGSSLNYAPGPPDTTMNAGVVTNAGGSQPVSVIQPVLAVTFIIALFGVFPSQS